MNSRIHWGRAVLGGVLAEMAVFAIVFPVLHFFGQRAFLASILIASAAMPFVFVLREQRRVVGLQARGVALLGAWRDCGNCCGARLFGDCLGTERPTLRVAKDGAPGRCFTRSRTGLKWWAAWPAARWRREENRRGKSAIKPRGKTRPTLHKLRSGQALRSPAANEGWGTPAKGRAQRAAPLRRPNEGTRQKPSE